MKCVTSSAKIQNKNIGPIFGDPSQLELWVPKHEYERPNSKKKQSGFVTCCIPFLQTEHPLSATGIDESCKDFFQRVDPVKNIEIYVIANQTDVPVDLQGIIDLTDFKRNTTICYSPIQPNIYGWCPAIHPQYVTIVIQVFSFLELDTHLKFTVHNGMGILHGIM